MEVTANKTGVLWQWFLKLTELFPMFRRPDLEQELTEAETRINCQKKRTERIRQRYDVLDRQCAAMSNEVDGLRSRLHATEQQAEAFKEVAKTYCAAVDTAEDLKRLYQAAAPYLDDGGFNLFDAAQEITGFSLSEEFPYPVLLIIYRFQPVVATVCLKSHIENAHMTGRYRREIALTDNIPGKGIIGGANRKYHLSDMVDKATRPNRIYLYSSDGL